MQLNSHRIRVKITQKDFVLNHVLARIGVAPHVSKAQRAPLLIHRMLPIDDLPPECALIGNTLTVGRGSRKIMLLGVFAHRAVG